MMRFISIYVFLAISTILVGCAVKTPIVERLKKDGTGYQAWSGDGIVYTLPRLGFDVQFEVSQIKLDVPKCDANKLTEEQQKIMGINPKIIGSGKREVYALHSTALTKRSVPDPDKVFISRFPESSGWADSSLQVNMGPNGTIEGSESSASSKSVAIATKLIEIAGSVGAAVIGLGSASPESVTAECQSKPVEFMALRQELANFRVAPTPYQKETLKQFIDEIKAEQAVIQAFYLGEPTVLKGSINCFVVPDKAGATNLLDIVHSKGFIPLGTSICSMDERFKASDSDGAAKRKTVSMDIEVTDDVMRTATRAGARSVPDSAGFFYSVPVRAFVSLSGHDKATIDRESYLFPQLGDVHALPQVEGSNPALVVSLHPETGALKSIKVTNNAADMAGMLSSTGTSVSSLLKAKTERDAKKDSLAVLQREQALLEAELAIETAKEGLEQLAQ